MILIPNLYCLNLNKLIQTDHYLCFPHKKEKLKYFYVIFFSLIIE